MFWPSLSPRLLLAHMGALFRRGCSGARGKSQRCITIRDLTVNASRREASLKERLLDLTSTEFDLLWYLARKAGFVVSRDDLYREVFHSEYNGVDRSIDVYISRIRQKLGDDPARPYYLKTVRGEGYLLTQG